MKKILFLLLIVFTTVQIQAIRVRQNFDFDWLFHLEGQPETKVQLPHDWSTAFEFNPEGSPESGFLNGGIGWYRKTFQIPSSHKNRHISVVFDGIYHKATIWLNGQEVAYHRYGYTSFEVNLTPYVRFGSENTLRIKVDHSEVSRWYTGSGIYRHVWLQVTDPIHVKTWGTYITTPRITDTEAEVKCVTTIENTTATETEVEVCQQMLDNHGVKIGKRPQAVSKLTVAAHASSDLSQTFSVSHPERWSSHHPYRYGLETVIRRGGKVIDRYVTRFGVRMVGFDADKGFSLNGQYMKLKGVCLHQDAGCLGVAVPDRAYERRLSILKESGVNAVRCSHNPPSPEFLNYCDSLGLLVIDEAFDKWKSGYYEAFFDSCWQQDIGDMIIRDRNHPSIILWSIGNEVREAGLTSDEGVDRAKMLQDFVHQLDFSRKVMLALQPAYQDKFACVTDVVGYNYGELALINDKKKHPDRIGLISEAYPYYSGMRTYEPRDYSDLNPWNYVKENDFICGSFIWAGVDYWGESMGWPSKGWAATLFDASMDEKPVMTYFRAVWNDTPVLRMNVLDYSLDTDPGKDHWQAPPMTHDWTFPYTDSRVIPIHTATNCDSVLLIDPRGKIYGPRSPQDYQNGTIVWNQPYRPGKIVAIGYRNGQEVCRDSIETSESKASSYRLDTDRYELHSDGQDMAFINLQLIDSKGIPVRIDDRRVSASVKGTGRLIGINSGDMRRKEPLNSHELQTFWGRCQLVVQSDRVKGVMVLEVSVEGLGEKRIEINVS